LVRTTPVGLSDGASNPYEVKLEPVARSKLRMRCRDRQMKMTARDDILVKLPPVADNRLLGPLDRPPRKV
jgi:hypothetical protein